MSKKPSLYKYIKSKGVLIQLKDFASAMGVTTQTLRNYYKEDIKIIDSYIKEYKERVSK